MATERDTPELWWSPRHGLISRGEGYDGEQVYWRHEDYRVSLRRNGLPNELPADAVALRPVVEDDETVEKLAKAAWETPGPHVGPYEDASESSREYAREFARVALRALREDTE